MPTKYHTSTTNALGNTRILLIHFRFIILIQFKDHNEDVEPHTVKSTQNVKPAQ